MKILEQLQHVHPIELARILDSLGQHFAAVQKHYVSLTKVKRPGAEPELEPEDIFLRLQLVYFLKAPTCKYIKHV